MAAATITGILLAACTNSGSSGDDLITEADRICSQANSKIDALVVPQNTGKAQPFLKKVDAIEHDAIDQLQQLQPTDDQKEQFQNMIDALKVALFYQPQLQEAVREKNLPAAEEVRLKISNVIEDASTIAKSLGLKVCAQKGTALK